MQQTADVEYNSSFWDTNEASGIRLPPYQSIIGEWGS